LRRPDLQECQHLSFCFLDFSAIACRVTAPAQIETFPGNFAAGEQICSPEKPRSRDFFNPVCFVSPLHNGIAIW
jgi:hypothetical protein